MRDLTESGISRRRLRKYIYNIYRVSKLHQEREKARQQLSKKITHLKTISRDARKRKHLAEEIKNLEHMIDMLVKAEKRHVTITPARSELHERLSEKLSALYEKLDEYLRMQERREKRVKELEIKVQGTTNPLDRPLQTKRILERLDDLETRYDHMKRRRLASPQDLLELRVRLDALRQKLL
jgi:hypothetical protein